jgi:hypothetical protein
MNNYIASKVSFRETANGIEIEGKLYEPNYDFDPDYIDDGVLNISYYNLYLSGGNMEPTGYLWVADKKENVEDPQEWSDVYDADNMYVLIFS